MTSWSAVWLGLRDFQLQQNVVFCRRLFPHQRQKQAKLQLPDFLLKGRLCWNPSSRLPGAPRLPVVAQQRPLRAWNRSAPWERPAWPTPLPWLSRVRRNLGCRRWTLCVPTLCLSKRLFPQILTECRWLPLNSRKFRMTCWDCQRFWRSRTSTRRVEAMWVSSLCQSVWETRGGRTRRGTVGPLLWIMCQEVSSMRVRTQWWRWQLTTPQRTPLQGLSTTVQTDLPQRCLRVTVIFQGAPTHQGWARQTQQAQRTVTGAAEAVPGPCGTTPSILLHSSPSTSTPAPACHQKISLWWRRSCLRIRLQETNWGERVTQPPRPPAPKLTEKVWKMRVCCVMSL